MVRGEIRKDYSPFLVPRAGILFWSSSLSGTFRETLRSFPSLRKARKEHRIPQLFSCEVNPRAT